MKSYWIAAAVFLATVWPVSQMHATSSQQALAEATSQSSAPPANLKNPAESAVTTKPAAGAAATVTPNPAAETAKPKAAYILVELSKGLNAKKLKVGDKVKAEVSQDVIAHGKVVIPVETKLVGRVTEVSPRDSSHPESRLGIVFDRILLKHVRDVDFQAIVQALGPPVIRKSRVDEPSQMLPPSMMGVPRNAPAAPTGRGTSASATSRPTGGGAGSASMATYQAPITVKQSPSTHADSSSALLEVASNGKPMSVGTPQGVFGLKGLSLTPTPSASTPGPVIVSNSDNVKLDSGTQILLQILKVEVPVDAKAGK